MEQDENLGYAEVIVPLSLNATFTYIVPAQLKDQVKIGSRVVVQFGARRFYTAIVTSVLSVRPPSTAGIELKEISEVLDPEPIIRRPQLQLWRWMADYYLCTIGDMLRAALPSGLKLESATFVELSPEALELLESGQVELTEDESIIYQHLSHAGKRLSLSELEKLTGIKRLSTHVSRLIGKEIAVISEKLVERYRTIKEPYVELIARSGVASENIRLFAAVSGAKKQETALLAMMELSGFMKRGEEPIEVSRKALMERAGVSSQVISALVSKGILRIVKKEISRFSYTGPVGSGLPELSDAQRNALNAIHKSWIEKDITLLHGVTSSGKTEIYSHLIEYVLHRGSQALLLVPEIALTTQLTTRLQKVFGNRVVIYHSKFSDNERVEIWNKLLHSTEPCVVIGARSAIFLPFWNLGLVIVDEEHESSYKQQDPAPRYNARDAATVLARLHGAKTLLGSATPSIETNYKALSGRFGYVRLTERFGGVSLPPIELVDLTEARSRGELNGSFATATSDALRATYNAGKQSIVFLNRRGYAPVAECRHCAYVPRCTDCDVTLTYHRKINRLVCHYCGAEYQLPKICPVCKEPGIEVHGYGTERLEEDLEKAIPHARIARMDLDTTRAKSSYDTIIDNFSSGKNDLLVGTQMVTKGLDFGGVDTVVVVNADSMINMPDYKASERAFNMLEQVAGRAGRREGEGRVIIQTRQPGHQIMQQLLNHDYDSFYADELQERKRYGYPPFTRLIVITIKHRDESSVNELAGIYAQLLRHLFGDRVYGPDKPTVGRIQTYFIRKIMLKFELNVSMKKIKELLLESYARLHDANVDGAKSVLISYDVDPS